MQSDTGDGKSDDHGEHGNQSASHSVQKETAEPVQFGIAIALLYPRKTFPQYHQKRCAPAPKAEGAGELSPGLDGAKIRAVLG